MKYYKSNLLGEWIKEGKYRNQRNTKQKNLGETGDKRKTTEVLLRYLSPRSAILRRATIVPTEKRKRDSWRKRQKKKKRKRKNNSSHTFVVPQRNIEEDKKGQDDNTSETAEVIFSVFSFIF